PLQRARPTHTDLVVHGWHRSLSQAPVAPRQYTRTHLLTPSLNRRYRLPHRPTDGRQRHAGAARLTARPYETEHRTAPPAPQPHYWRREPPARHRRPRPRRSVPHRP